MISNTTGRLFFIHSNAFLQNKWFFPHVLDFTLIYASFSYLNRCPFWPYFDGFFFFFFKCSLTFRAYALQFELNKAGYTNLANFCDDYHFLYITDCHKSG